EVEAAIPSNVTVSTTCDETTRQRLVRGDRVVLFPPHKQLSDNTVPPQFIGDFWNWLVFKKSAESMKRPVSGGTLGILADPRHPLFDSFPTDSHPNWQWWSITKNARPLI